MGGGLLHVVSRATGNAIGAKRPLVHGYLICWLLCGVESRLGIVGGRKHTSAFNDCCIIHVGFGHADGL